jgi:hypothetical protein
MFQLCASESMKTGFCAKISDGRSGSDEGERRTEDFVARADAGQTQGEMQGGGARRHGDGVLRADEDREIFLEGVEIRHPPVAIRIGLEGFEDEFDFGGADVRRGEEDTGRRHWV